MRRRPGRRGLLALGALASSWAGAWPASAQTTAGGWALDRHEPSPAGDAFFIAELPWYRSARLVAAGITLGYAVDPLWLRLPRDGMVALERAVVSGMLTSHLGVALSPLDRLGFHLSLPISLHQSGTALPAGAGDLGPTTGPAFGDLRAGVRVRVVGDAERDPASLHLGATVWLPTGSPSDNTGDGAARVEPRVVLAGHVSKLRWSASAGFHVRGEVSALNLAVGNELRVTAAASVSALGDRVSVGPEAYLFSSLRELPNRRGNAAFGPGQWGVEAVLGVRVRVADSVQVGLAGAVGFGDGYGVPAGRGLLSVVYTSPSRRPERRVTVPPEPPPAPTEPVPPTNSFAAEAPVAPAEPAAPAPTEPVAPAAPVALPTTAEPSAPVTAVTPAVASGGAASGPFVQARDPIEFRPHREEVHGARSRRALDEVAAILRSAPQLAVDVQVHTGHRSDPGFYRELTERRAAVVRQHLIDRGVPADRLQSHGMGTACQVRPRPRGGDTARVQFVVVSTGVTVGQCVRPPARGPEPGASTRDPRTGERR